MLSILGKLFQSSREERPGAIITIDPLAARVDLIYGAPDTTNLPPSVSHLKEFGIRHLQGGSPFCVSYATTHLKERDLQKQGTPIELEPDYTALSSRTGIGGNSVQTVLDTEKAEGFVASSDLAIEVSSLDYSKLPLPVPELNDVIRTRAKTKRWNNYAFLRPYVPEELKSNLVLGPIGITFGLEGS